MRNEAENNEIKSVKNLAQNIKDNEPLVLEVNEAENLYIKTLDNVRVAGKIEGYVMVTEQANEILTAVKERKNFILRTVLAIGVVIFIFLVFLSRYILKPIEGLVAYAESIKAKDESMGKIQKFLYHILSKNRKFLFLPSSKITHMAYLLKQLSISNSL